MKIEQKRQLNVDNDVFLSNYFFLNEQKRTDIDIKST